MILQKHEANFKTFGFEDKSRRPGILTRSVNGSGLRVSSLICTIRYTKKYIRYTVYIQKYKKCLVTGCYF